MADLFAAQVPLCDQVAEVERELALRRRVYPRWVAKGDLRQDTADRQVSVMEAVLATLRGLG